MESPQQLQTNPKKILRVSQNFQQNQQKAYLIQTKENYDNHDQCLHQKTQESKKENYYYSQNLQQNQDKTKKKISIYKTQQKIKLMKECNENPLNVPYYFDQIFEYYQQKDRNIQPLNQQKINQNMRWILVDWLINVCHNFKLREQTLFHAIFMIDLFLQKNQIERCQFQLLGVTCLLLSCKINQINYPKLEKFSYITDNTYTTKEIIEFELKILLNFDFKFDFITRFDYIQAFFKFLNLNQENQNQALYLLNLTLLNDEINIHSEQEIAASICYYLMQSLQKNYFQIIQKSQINEKNLIQICIQFQNYINNSKISMNVQEKLKKNQFTI